MSVVKRLAPEPGLRVLVSAGASGIGAAIASAFHDAGAKIHVCDISPEAMESFQARFPDAVVTPADVASANDVARVYAAQQDRFGGLDILVNNAGIAGPTAGIDAMDEAEWSRTVDVNLNGQYRFATHGVPMLKASAHAHMICMSSVAGRLGYAWRTPYAATKWAIVGLVKSLAAELGPAGVRVNALLPGIIEGPRIDGVIAARAKQLNLGEAEMRQAYIEKISLRRMTTAEDVAAMALFLSSPAARNITGQAISVDGNVEYL